MRHEAPSAIAKGKTAAAIRRGCLASTNADSQPNSALSKSAGYKSSSALKELLLGSAASIALLCLSNTEALADCVETSPSAYDCTGQILDPLNTTGSVTVDADSTAVFVGGVSISGPGTSTFDNDGTIDANMSADANTSFVFTNNGTLNTDVSVTNNTSVTVNNNGLLDNAVRAADNERFDLNNHGVIDGGVFLSGSGNNIIINFNDGDVQNGVTSSGNSHDTVINHGFFAGSIALDDGNDVLRLLDGTVDTTVDMGAGDDEFIWRIGNVAATVQMGDGDDFARFENLTQENLTAGKVVDGGLGTDTLLWRNTTNDDGSGSGDHPSSFINWEDFSLTNGSELTFIYTTGFLTLGDSQTGTGTLSIDPSSSVLAGNSFGYGIQASDSSQLVTVNNAGTIDLTNDVPGSGSSLHDTFTIQGNYVGQSGALNLHTMLESDDAPSDKLIISGGSGSGSTGISITNVDGQGALTTGNGIRVIDATNGATTTTDAFSLNGRVAAGLFEYGLYRGGVTEDPDNDDDWFLRNFVSPPPPPPPPPPSPPSPPPPSPPGPDPDPDPTPGPDPDPTPGPDPDPTPGPDPDPTPGPDPDPTPGPDPDPTPGPPTPNIRPEVPGYVKEPGIVQKMGLAALGTFHERQGDQFLLNNFGRVPGGWMRLYGEKFDRTWSSRIGQLDYELSPSFEGTLGGFQAGLDLVGILHDDESQDRAGLFFAYTNVSGDSIGHVLARRNVKSGSIDIDGTSLGGYWTHIDPEGRYLDAVAMYTWLGGSVGSVLGEGTDVSGGAFLASLEGGYPIQIGENWTLEPQGQIIWQNIDIDDTQDAFSNIYYDSFSSWTGRLGLRLEGNTTVNGAPVQPFLAVNLWHDFDNDYTVSFNRIPVVTNLEKTWVEFGGGISAQVTENFSTYGAVSAAASLDGDGDRSYSGNLGFRLKW